MPEPTSLRIVHVLNHVLKANGHVCAMVDLACTQAKFGHKVSVCSGGGDFENLLSEHGITHVKIDHTRNVLVLLKSMIALARSFRRLKPDIVHAHMMTSAVLVASVLPLFRSKLVTTVHNDFEKSATLMKLGHRVIAVSDASRKKMVARGISAKKMRTVLNGTLGSPRFPVEIVPRALPKHPAITFVGGMHPRKGVTDLIEAHAQVIKSSDDAHLYLVGDGPFRERYQKLAEQLAPGRITFCGYSDDPRTYLADSDIFVLPSHSDPAPLVMSEAREAGCAIIGADVGGIPELIEHGKAGILVPPKNPDRLAEAILSLLNEPDYLSEMRNRSKYNIEKMTVARVTEETIRVYRELL
jgi:glycosyltransferase involved in cell wall biosynthesis